MSATSFNDLTGPQIVAAYNDLAKRAGEKQVTRFSDRETALKRLSALDEKVNSGGPSGPKATTKQETTDMPRSSAKTKPDTESTGRRGRASAYAGMKLRVPGKENPRREGSHGHRSLQIILDNPGIKYEDFIAAGGRNNDLAWDVTKGVVVAS